MYYENFKKFKMYRPFVTIPGDDEPIEYNLGRLKSKVLMRALDDCQPESYGYLNVKKGDVVEYVGIANSGLPVGFLNNHTGYIGIYRKGAYKVSFMINIKN